MAQVIISVFQVAPGQINPPAVNVQVEYEAYGTDGTTWFPQSGSPAFSVSVSLTDNEQDITKNAIDAAAALFGVDKKDVIIV